MAILFVTVLVDDDETAEDAKTLPVCAGIVNVKLDAVSAAVTVTTPFDDDLSAIFPAMLSPYTTTQVAPLDTVTVTPLSTAIGPALTALFVAAIV